MDYVPYYELTGRPNVIADGASRKSTVLTLSHWPRSGTPWPLKADLSAEIAFRYLDSPQHHVDVDAVSNDHLDLDGFITVLALARTSFALAHRDSLVAVARTGDFAVATDSHARRIAFTLAALVRRETSTFDPATFELDRPLQVAALYRLLLEEVQAVVEDIDRYEALWAPEEQRVAASEEAFAAGRASVEERTELDLAVVRLDPSLRTGGQHDFSIQGYGPIHPLAVHARTGSFRILYLQGDRYGLCYRFESWVQHVSRRPARRVDLTALADELTQAEEGGGRWSWAWPRDRNPPVPWLRMDDGAPSTIPEGELIERLSAALGAAQLTAPDPYDDGAPSPSPYGATEDLVARAARERR